MGRRIGVDLLDLAGDCRDPCGNYVEVPGSAIEHVQVSVPWVIGRTGRSDGRPRAQENPMSNGWLLSEPAITPHIVAWSRPMLDGFIEDFDSGALVEDTRGGLVRGAGMSSFMRTTTSRPTEFTGAGVNTASGLRQHRASHRHARSHDITAWRGRLDHFPVEKARSLGGPPSGQ